MTTALYRRYRPETFAEVVGQDHVTGPLRQALRSGQINHAYLFSGPRGCGKTTSARILARCLNCAEGPTDTPCGVCPSCVELARGGPGSLDVVEIDAASHGGVDDARDLRERATFAPARDRFKVFILDEAHMVSPQGFNALLKIVEEPPEHVKFIFATTEPDKVIGTIRSRTHHYPFRLVPPETMTDYLGQICGTEGITVGSGVLPLVVRAGGGSVRDSLSVLDQLIAGSGPDGLVYEDAVALLGYTHASLLDDLVEAIAARDGASAFRVVERVISTGHEPRRFVEDLLERLRDLIVLQASGEAADAVLRDIPGDQLARMRTQAQHLGASELSRSADLANAALTEMSGATSPRLHLELLMARLLLPAMDDSAAGLGARVDRLERTGVPAGPAATGQAPAVNPVTPVERVAVVTGPVPTTETTASGAALARAAMAAAGRGGGQETAGSAVAGDRGAEQAVAAGSAAGLPDGSAAGADGAVPGLEGAAAGPDGAEAGPDGDSGAADGTTGDRDGDAGRSEAATDRAGGDEVRSAVAPDRSVPDHQGDASERAAGSARTDVAPVPQEPEPEPQPEATASVPAGGAPADPGPATARTGAGQDTEMLRRRWPEVLETLAGLKKTTWVLISQNAQVIELDATTLTLGFTAPGLATAFRGGQHAELVHQAVRETLGFDVRVEGVLAGDTPTAPVATVRPGAPAPSGS
ncbi:DNA polymerase III subunit gamma and tau, partial [Cellulomonas denverensis]